MPKYVDSVLIRGEKIEYQAELHWKIYFTINSLLTLGIAPIIRQRTSEFVITNKRVITKIGLISRKTFEMNLHKIESVHVDQSLFGRLLGFGTVTIIGTGGSRESFTDISEPLIFRRKFQEIELTEGQS